MAATLLAAGGEAAEDAARTRVVLLPLESHALAPEDLDAAGRRLAERFRADEAIELVDALPLLVERASDDWLKADKLLYDGIQDYQNLQFVKAVEQLGESAELMERTFREFADAQGRRRMRDAYLHLGLARLEQGEQNEAEEWFARAARVDPGFQPDPRSYPPAVRAKFQQAKRESLDASYEASRERLRELAKLVGVDVVVAGSVRRAADDERRPTERRQEAPRWFVEIAWVDRWSGRSAVDSVEAHEGSPDAIAAALDGAAPKLIAGVLQRPWPPALAARRSRRRITVGPTAALLPAARIVRSAGGGQVYEWSDTLVQRGAYVSFSPWERGAWSVETDVSVFAPQPMSSGGWETTFEATGEIQGAAAVGARAVRTVKRGGWGVAGGAGLAFNEAIASFRSPQTETGVVYLWFAPVVSLAASRTLLARGTMETFVELKVNAEWDALDAGPSDWRIQSVAAGGVTF